MTLPTLPALSPRAKAYAAAVITFLSALLSADEFDTRSVLTAVLASLVGGGGVYAVPNANYPQRAKPRRVLDLPLLNDPPAPPPV